jgi:uncharacterized protein YkwD
MERSRRLNAEEPGAERRQVAIEAVNETNAERIERNAKELRWTDILARFSTCRLSQK